jgi:hypothetical protein
MAGAMLLKSQLTGEQEEWLLRAAFGSPRGVMPSSTVAALVAAGLGAKNLRGTLDVNDAGRLYLNARDLSMKTDKRPRFHR